MMVGPKLDAKSYAILILAVIGSILSVGLIAQTSGSRQDISSSPVVVAEATRSVADANREIARSNAQIADAIRDLASAVRDMERRAADREREARADRDDRETRNDEEASGPRRQVDVEDPGVFQLRRN